MTPNDLIEQTAQCLLLGDSPSGLRSLDAAARQPLSDLQRLTVATLRIRLHTATGAFHLAHQVARETLDMLELLTSLPPVERLHFQVAQAELALESGDLLSAELGVAQAWEEVQRQPTAPPLPLLTSLYLLRGAVALGRGHSAQAGQILLEALQQVRLSELPSLEGAAFAERLGQLCLEAGALTPAQSLLEQAVRLRSRELGADHPVVAQAINLLGRVALERGDGQAAEALLSHALRLQSLRLGLEHPATGVTLQNLAMAWKLQGQYQRAAAMLTKLLRAWTVSPLVDHPTFAFALDNLSALLVLSGDLEGALEAKRESARRLDGLLEQLLKVGTESQRRAFYERLQGLTDHTVGLHLQHLLEREDAARLALTTVLQRKGRLLEAILGTLQRQRMPKQQEEAAWLEEWRWTQRELAQLLLGGRETGTVGETAARRRALESRLETLERQMSDGHASESLFPGGEGLREALAGRGLSGRDNQTEDLIGEVIQSLPPGAALLELVRYGVRANSPTESQTSESGEAPSSPPIPAVVHHYGAYLLRADGTLGWWALGEAAPIDAAAERLLKGLSTPNPRLSGEAARTLYQKLLQPCEAALGEVTRLYIGADGALNLVPFGTLIDGQDQLLLQRLTISLVTSGRELLQARRVRKARVSHRTPTPEQPVGEDLYRFAR